jgi:2-polyprenyl-3-methyl-5-hydroxy-6-metoxy-1,4-benzoquinol methylase
MSDSNRDQEAERLDDVADWYQTDGFYSRIVEYGFSQIRPFFKRGNCLELGCADGEMTHFLVREFEQVVAVDGAKKHCEQVRQRFEVDNLSVVCSLFENYQPTQQFDTVIMAHILEHIKDPVKLLARAEDWLRDDGRIIVIVPNGNSLHRIVGSEMGVIRLPNEIDEHDEELGHRRVYLPEEIDADVRDAGLEIVASGGIGLKPLTNEQIDDYLNKDIQDAYLTLGQKFPRIAAERFVVARSPATSNCSP